VSLVKFKCSKLFVNFVLCPCILDAKDKVHRTTYFVRFNAQSAKRYKNLCASLSVKPFFAGAIFLPKLPKTWFSSVKLKKFGSIEKNTVYIAF